MSSILEVQDLHKFYRTGFFLRKTEVLKGVSFSVQQGKITGFLGRNGAGKTSTLKCVLGLTLASQGSIRFFGGQTLSSSVKSKIGFLPERPYFYEYLTGEEFLKFYGQLSTKLKSQDLKSRIDQVLDKVGLSHARTRFLRNYSKGMLQRIGIAQALIHEPQFVILDEPMTGLEPDGRFQVNEIIREVARQGTTVFFSSHLLHDAEMLCDDLVIISRGQLLYQGPMEKFIERLQSGWRIVWSLAQGQSEKTVATVEELQLEIDSIRKGRGQILSVQSIKPSLEEAFVRQSPAEGKP